MTLPTRMSISSRRSSRAKSKRCGLTWERWSRCRIRYTTADIVTMGAAGGGGFGDACDRDAQGVLDDVIDGYVTIEEAERKYGVVITGDSPTIDVKATEKRRARMRGPAN